MVSAFVTKPYRARGVEKVMLAIVITIFGCA